MAFRPEAGRRLPSGKLREPGALMIKRNQLVEMRKKRTTSDQSEPIGNTRPESANSENAVLTQLVPHSIRTKPTFPRASTLIAYRR